MGYEKSYSEVLAVKLDEMLRVLEFGREEKKKDQGVLGVESDGTTFINGQGKWLNKCLFTWIILPEVVRLGIQIFWILMAFWFFWRAF